ncbi:MAG: methyltransferase domain-containing protein [Rickettsiales bacterium]|nr:methyltransferase domain-containing protein [Rickettsiales bacterium]
MLESGLEAPFDRNLLRKNHMRYVKTFQDFNFLYAEVANKIIERLGFLQRDFDRVLEIGARDGYLSAQIKLAKNSKFIVQSEVCDFGVLADNKIIADEEFLPFKNNSFDLIVSSLNLQHVNLIPQFLVQVKNLLKEDGVFIASFFGEENLSELAHVVFESENEIYNGISPRMPPTIETKTAAHLLQKAGFKNPISDFEKIEVSYENPLKLLKDLKMMGQGNALNKRSRRFFTKGFLQKLCKNYIKKYSDEEGVKATFEIVTVTGWKSLKRC